MTIHLSLPGDPAPMTGRARAYLWVGALRTMPVAIACVVSPASFSGPAFDYIDSVMPMSWWAVALGASAVSSGIAATFRREWMARMALIGSAALAACWAIGFIVAWAHGNLLSPVGVMWGLGIAAKDLIVCRQPMWSPFEPLVQRILSKDRKGRPARTRAA